MPSLRYIDPEVPSPWRSLRLVAPLAMPCLSVARGPEPVVLLPSGALVCQGGTGVRVNGRPMPGGLRVLADLDEIRIAAERFFFTERDPLAVEAHQGEAAACPRCGGPIQPGAEVLRCHCGTVFHQSADQPCFTYGETCPSCGGSTQLEVSPWDPSEL